MPTLKETGSRAAYYKHTAPGSPNRFTRTLTPSINTHTLCTLEGLVQWADLTWPQHWPQIVIPASASMVTPDGEVQLQYSTMWQNWLSHIDHVHIIVKYMTIEWWSTDLWPHPTCLWARKKQVIMQTGLTDTEIILVTFVIIVLTNVDLLIHFYAKLT